MKTAVVTCSQVSIIRNQITTCSNVSFTLFPGQSIHVTGTNGSGKTSLLKALLNLIPTASGHIVLFDKPIHQCEREDFASVLFIGHQQSIKNNLSVCENLRFNARIFDNIFVDNKILQETLNTVGLAPIQSYRAAKLSAGQKQRLNLARLWLSHNQSQHKVWFLDEPLTAIDANFQEVLCNLINQFLHAGGCVIFTSHQTLSLNNQHVLRLS